MSIRNEQWSMSDIHAAVGAEEIGLRELAVIFPRESAADLERTIATIRADFAEGDRAR